MSRPFPVSVVSFLFPTPGNIREGQNREERQGPLRSSLSLSHISICSYQCPLSGVSEN
jgi:hypothetical protein